MRIQFAIVLSFCLSHTVTAGVNDYFIYDRGERYQLEKLDGIVSAKIINYYAFADPGLVITLDEERKKVQGQELQPESLTDVRISSTKGTEYLYTADPALNSILQLKRNSLWIFDVEILEVLDGNIERNRAFVAMKRTRAFKFYEHPPEIISSASSNLILGLVKIEKDDFSKDFRGLTCYLENNLSAFERNSSENLRDRFLIDYDSIFRSFKPTKFYVAREIGTNQRYTVRNGQIQIYQKESELMQELKKKQMSASKNP